VETHYPRRTASGKVDIRAALVARTDAA